MIAYLQTCNTNPDGNRDSFLTQSVPVKRAPMAHHLAGLSWTATGYGRRIPTEYMVQVSGKWRRVYCRIYSNIGTLFIGRRISDGFIIQIQD
jgi:hypothetical protein